MTLTFAVATLPESEHHHWSAPMFKQGSATMLLYWSWVLITERVMSPLLQKRSITALPRLNIGALWWLCSDSGSVDSITVAKRVRNLTIELLIRGL